MIVPPSHPPAQVDDDHVPSPSSTPARHVPVLILGGGPTGLALALELGMHGVPATVVEPRRLVEHARPRAKTTSARTMEYFRRWGVADAVRAAAAIPVSWSDRVTFCSTVTGREVTFFEGVLGLDLAGSDLVAESGQQVTQPVIEEVLREAVESSPTATLVLGARGVEVDARADGVRIVLEHDDGTRSVVEADYVVGADGPRSVVRAAMGARYVGAPTGRPNVNITFRAPGLAARIPHPPSVHYWVLNPESPGVVGPLDLQGTWWAISTGTASVADDAEAKAIVHRLLGSDDVDVEVVATDPWQARMLLADRYRAGRLFLVGDAAHQNPPWGGHGFNTGIGDAANLGWKLAAVLQGWAPDALLDSYESERRPVAQATIDVAASNAATLSVDLTDPALMSEGPAFEIARRRAAEVVQRTKDAEFHSAGLVLGTGYAAAAAAQAPTLAQYIPSAEPGNRLPHRLLADDRSSFDALGAGLTVIGPADATAALIAAAERRGIPVTATDLDGALDAADDVLVVRPDEHIAWRGAPPDDGQADAALDAALLGFSSLHP